MVFPLSQIIPDPPHFPTLSTSCSLPPLSLPQDKNKEKQDVKIKNSKIKYTRAKQKHTLKQTNKYNIESVLYSPTAAGHEDLSWMWVMCSVASWSS